MSNPGKYRFLVRIEQKAEPAQSGTGAIGPATWTLFAEAYASIEPIRARDAEILAASQEKAIADAKICIRGIAGVTAQMRVVHPLTGKVYDIKSVTLDDTLTWEASLFVVDGLNQG